MAETKKQRLDARRVLARVISVVVCGVGAAACAYSLCEQIQESSNLTASICWFAGLASVVAGLAGYTVTCAPHYRNMVAGATVIGVLIAAGVFCYDFFVLGNIRSVIVFALGTIVVQALVLVILHFILKREDPLAA